MVSAIIVTRGDVDLAPVLESLPTEWERIIWDNGAGKVVRHGPQGSGSEAVWAGVSDLIVFGRYAAIKHASQDLIYCQDDDVIVSDPQAIVDTWLEMLALAEAEHDEDPASFLVANMPQEFRPHYPDSCLVGFGSCFHRDAPSRAFARFEEEAGEAYIEKSPFFHRTCDVVFTTLMSRVLMDVPITHREFASDPGRMWKQPGNVEERTRMLNLARKVRDA